MAGRYGTAEHGAVVAEAAAWPITLPSAPANGALLLVVNSKAKAWTMTGLGADWTQVVKDQPIGPGKMQVFYRSMSSGFAGGSMTLAWNAPVAGSWICIALSSAIFHSISSWAELEGAGEITMPTVSSPGANALRIDILGSDEWMRLYVPGSSEVTATHEPCSGNGPGLTVGTRVIGAGSSAGAKYIPDDPSDGEDGAYSGSADWCRTLACSIVFRDVATVPPASGSQSGVAGSVSVVALTSASPGITVPSSPAGGSRVILVHHMRQSDVSVGAIAGWELSWASQVDDGWGNRLYCFTQSTPAAVGSTVVSLPINGSGDVRGVAVALAHSGPLSLVSGASTGYQTSISTPSATVASDQSSYVTVAGTANFIRNLSISGLTQVTIPPGVLGDRGYGLGVAHGPTSSGFMAPPIWSPSDPYGAEGGDAWRALTLVFGPAGSSGETGPVGSVTKMRRPISVATEGSALSSSVCSAIA